MDEATIGPYRVLESLGHGRMGEALLVLDTRSGDHRVLKRPSDAWLSQPGAARRLRDEAEAAIGLRHPRIAALLAVVDVDGHPYLVLDYVAGEPLAALIARGRMTVERALVVAIDVAEAVAAAHDAGVVHHDITPFNIRLAPDGRAVVLGFGEAKVRPPSDDDVPVPIASSLLEGPRFLGTPGYAAPEQITGRTANRQSDIHGIGAVMFEMLTGRRPFHGADAADVTLATLTEPVPPVRRYNADAPPALDAIVGRALAKNPRDRFASAADLARELKQTLRSLGERPVVPLDEQWTPANPTAARPATPGRRRILIVVFAAALLALILALAMF